MKWNATTDSCNVGNLAIHRIVELEGQPFPAENFFLDADMEMVRKLASDLGPRHVDFASFELLLSFQSFLIRTTRYTILVDMCIGNDKQRLNRPHWHMRQGEFLDNLAKVGVRPEDVDYIMCTHLHADHVGWNTRLVNGEWVPTFPNAQYLIAEKEYKHWLNEHEAGPAEPIQHGSFIDSVLPVVESGQAVMVDVDHGVEAGVYFEPAFGHTPGNVIIHVEAGGEHAIVCGDAIHHPVQLARPDWSTQFCWDPAQSAATRRAMLEEHADTGTFILPAHFQSPAYGAITRDGDGFRLAD